MKQLVLILMGMSFGISLFGQGTIDILTISGRYASPEPYDSVYTGKAQESGFMVNLVAPIELSKKTIWYNSLNYFYWNVTNDEEMPTDIANPIGIHGFILRTGLYQKFSKGRGIQLFFVPRLMSDLNNINGQHYQFGGIVMYEKKFHDRLTMKFGGMLNQELFGPYLVPLVDLKWKISERWSITGLLPVYSKINYKVSDQFTAGINHFGLITTYKLGDPAYQGDYIERSSIDVGFFGRYRLAGNIYVEGRFGRTLDRSYAQYAADQKVDFSIPLVGFGDDRVQKNVSFQDGIYANIRLVYNLPIPEE